MPHLRALDGLRGLSILAVLAYHSGLLSGGFVGVDLFFALSGFLITRLLITEHDRHGDIRLLGFWARRALRLGPALVAAVLLAIAVSRAIGMPLEPAWILATLLYASNLLIGYAHVYPIGLLSHTWSLGMEEQFYLLWPPLVVLAMRWGARGVCGAAALLSIVPALLRSAWVAAHPGNPYADPELWTRVYFAPDMRFDAIALGCLAGAASLLFPAPGRTADRVATGAALLGLGWLGHVCVSADIGTLVSQPLLFSLTSLAATATVVAAARETALARALGWAPLVGLGKISYGLYLYHVIVFVGLGDEPVGVRWAVAIALASASWWLWERPFLRLKPRFERGVRGVAAAAAVDREG
ncbi:MAG: acyltransferase [Deltaproteobacteria bacterium]|nr:acyltransferase [Deltaproteobacteria bacterium]